MPTELGQLADLQTINMYNSGTDPGASGTLPTQLALLGKMSELHLQGNLMLSGTLPQVNLTHIRARECPGLSGTLPANFGVSKAAQSLVLGDGKMSGTLSAAALGAIDGSEFQTLFLENMQFISGTLPTQLGLGNIGSNYYSTFRLREGVQVSGTLPTEIGALSSKLQYLDLYTNMSGTVPEEVGLLTKLKTIQLVNRMSGTVPESLVNLTSLSSSGCKLDSFFQCPFPVLPAACNDPCILSPPPPSPVRRRLARRRRRPARRRRRPARCRRRACRRRAASLWAARSTRARVRSTATSTARTGRAAFTCAPSPASSRRRRVTLCLVLVPCKPAAGGNTTEAAEWERVASNCTEFRASLRLQPGWRLRLDRRAWFGRCHVRLGALPDAQPRYAHVLCGLGHGSALRGASAHAAVAAPQPAVAARSAGTAAARSAGTAADGAAQPLPAMPPGTAHAPPPPALAPSPVPSCRP